MSRGRDLPVIIGKGHRKGILGWVDNNQRAVVNIVWLKRDVKSGTEFQLSDIDKFDISLWFCDKDSIDYTIGVLEELKKKMGVIE